MSSHIVKNMHFSMLVKTYDDVVLMHVIRIQLPTIPVAV